MAECVFNQKILKSDCRTKAKNSLDLSSVHTVTLLRTELSEQIPIHKRCQNSSLDKVAPTLMDHVRNFSLTEVEVVPGFLQCLSEEIWIECFYLKCLLQNKTFADLYFLAREKQ